MFSRLIFVAVMLSLAPAAFADGLTWEPALPSESFVNSIGVCTHWSYGDTPYGQSFDTVKERLAESGIRNIRDGYNVREDELWSDLGIRSTVLAEPQGKTLAEQMAIWNANPLMFGMIEGPNEPNNFWGRFNVQYKGKGWPEGLRLWQADLYSAVRSDLALDNIPVTSPTPIFDGPAIAAPITSFDYMAIHPYPGGGLPSSSIVWGGQTLRTAISLIGTGSNLKPFVATETGYHNCTASDQVIGSQQRGISELAGGKYFPRLFAEYWLAGFARTFTYELLDEFVKPDDPEANFGMLRHDLTPKPAFTAVSNMIALLSDKHWDTAHHVWAGPDSRLCAIDIAVDGPQTVHHLLLSRADGSVDLLLWNEISSYDIEARKDITNGDVPVSIQLAEPATAALYRPLTGLQKVKTWSASRTINVDVPDEVIILRLDAARGRSGLPAQAPIALSAVTTGTSASLSWKSSGARPVAFIVRRLGRYVSSVTPTSDGSGTYTDTSLSPGLGYTYTVESVSRGGHVSTPASVIASTLNLRPDLTINSVSWSPENPKAGDEVRFTAIIANIGMASTPAVTHGVSFSIDGHVICWSDTSSDPLAPNQTRALVTDSGPLGKGTWTAVTGQHTLTATVDDVNRIDESNKLNNTIGPISLTVN